MDGKVVGRAAPRGVTEPPFGPPPHIKKQPLGIDPNEPTKLMVFPKPCRLTIDDGTVLEFAKGVNAVPMSLIQYPIPGGDPEEDYHLHPTLQHYGVEPYDGKSSAAVAAQTNRQRAADALAALGKTPEEIDAILGQAKPRTAQTLTGLPTGGAAGSTGDPNKLRSMSSQVSAAVSAENDKATAVITTDRDKAIEAMVKAGATPEVAAQQIDRQFAINYVVSQGKPLDEAVAEVDAVGPENIMKEKAAVDEAKKRRAQRAK